MRTVGVAPWWGWLLVLWGAVAVVAALWIAVAAGTARLRERAARAHQYETEAARHRRFWGRAGWTPDDGSSGSARPMSSWPRVGPRS